MSASSCAPQGQGCICAFVHSFIRACIHWTSALLSSWHDQMLRNENKEDPSLGAHGLVGKSKTRKESDRPEDERKETAHLAGRSTQWQGRPPGCRAHCLLLHASPRIRQHTLPTCYHCVPFMESTNAY